MELSERQEREARARADISVVAMYSAIVGLGLVAAFSFFMVFSERAAGG